LNNTRISLTLLFSTFTIGKCRPAKVPGQDRADALQLLTGTGAAVTLYNTIGYPLLAISLFEITLGIVLLRNPRKSRVQKALAALSFFSAAFSFTSASMYLRAGLGLSIDWMARLSWIGWFTVPAALQILFFLKDEQGRLGNLIGSILYPVWLVLFGLCLFTDLIVRPGYSVIPFINHPGPLENPARLFGSALAVWLLIETIRAKKRLSGIRKQQLNYFFQGVLIFGGGAAFTAGFLQVLGGFPFEPSLAAFFSLPWVVLTYYAITRHRLFDIQLIFSRVLSVLLLVALFSIIQLWLIRLLSPALGGSLSIVISLAILGLIFSFTRINRHLQRFVQQVVVQDKYDYRRVLQESINSIVTILELDELLDYIIASMKNSLGAGRAYLILKDRQGAYSRTYGWEGFPVRERTPDVKAIDRWLLRSGHSVVRNELRELSSPEAEEAHNVMNNLDAELIVPLLYKGDIRGVIVLGEKGDKEPYFQSDIDLLESLAAHAAVAMENAQLYEDARRMRDSIRESEAKFRTLAETAATAIFIHRGGNFLYANKASEVIGGYSVAEYLNMNFIDLVHPDFTDLVLSRYRERMAGASDVPAQYEFKILRRNGDERWVLMTAGVSQFDGTPAIIGTLIDITERKHAEEERNSMALLVESSSDLIAMAGMDHRLLYMNKAGRKLVGLEDVDIRNLKTDDLYFPEDLSAFRAGSEPNNWRGEIRIKHYKTGAAIPVDRYHFFVSDKETGSPVARAAVMRDITDLKRIREEREQLQELTLSLKESEAKFRTLAETTTAAIFIHQGQKLVYANPAAEIMTGYSSEDLLHEDFWSLIHTDYQDLVREHGLARLSGRAVPKDYECKFIKKNGEACWVAMTAGFIDYGGKPAIIATLFDITEWKNAEEAKVRFYEEGVRQYEGRINEEKRHLREKEKILMDLHDGIGGITTNISILSQMALDAADREHQMKMLTTISRLAGEGISEIRSFMHSLDSKELNWKTLATELRKLGTDMLETYNIRFSFIITKDIGDVDEQPGSLTWVNMFKIYKEALTNVIKHAKATEVSVSFSIGRDAVSLAVKDNGIGCNGTEGNGRGLANMRTRAEDIGGTVSLSNHDGTIISLLLPLPLKYPAGGMENLLRT
jgi:PAS domain S-box-containing protein